MNTARNPGVVHAPAGRYVHQIEVTNPTRILFISGQVGMEQDGTIPEDPVSAGAAPRVVTSATPEKFRRVPRRHR